MRSRVSVKRTLNNHLPGANAASSEAGEGAAAFLPAFASRTLVVNMRGEGGSK